VIGKTIVNSGCGTCYSIAAFDANSFTVTSSAEADLTFPVLYASGPLASTTLAVTAINGTEFQSSNEAVYTVTQTASGGYSGGMTLSCGSATATGISCSFSPAVITGSGTSTLTVTAGSSATTGAGTFVVTGTDGTNSEASMVQNLTIWAGPVQQWYMNEGTSPMADSSGNANNLTNSGVTYSSIGGLLPNAVTYNGSTSATVATNAALTDFSATTPVSACAWAVQTSNSAEQALAGDLNASNNSQGWEFGYAGAGLIETNLIANAGAGNLIRKLFNGPASGVHHICFTYDGSQSAAGVLMYVDAATATVNSIASDSLTGSTAGGLPVNVGMSNGGVNNFSGGIADVRIFNYSLTQVQVQAIYAGGVK
jgi:hypothetical protein